MAAKASERSLVRARAADADERLVQEAIAHIRALARRAYLEAVVQIGDYLIDAFFGGDLELARSNNPLKPVALSRLLERADETEVSQAALRRAVRVSVQYRELPASTRQALSLRQQMALLPVEDRAVKAKLASQAAAKNLSGDAIRRLARGESGDARTGRPPLPIVEKVANQVVRALSAPDLKDALAPAALRALGGRRGDIARKLREARELLERVSDAVERAAR